MVVGKEKGEKQAGERGLGRLCSSTSLQGREGEEIRPRDWAQDSGRRR
jgi:hypothetical protein